MKDRRRDFFLSVGASLFFAVLVVGGLAVLFQVGRLLYAQLSERIFEANVPRMREQDAVDAISAQVSLPESVALGERFQMTLLLDNLGRDNVYVERIQFPACFGELAAYEQVFPMPSRIDEQEIATTYYYDEYDGILLFSEREIEDSSQTLIFTFLAEDFGNCEGEILVGTANASVSASFALMVDVPIGGDFLPQGEILFQDDFSTTMNTWYPYLADNANGYRFQGQYVIDVDAKAIATPDLSGRDFPDLSLRATLEARKTDDASGYYGLLCRYSSPRRYYAFVLSLDGQYAIWKLDYGDKTVLQDWQPVPMILDAERNSLTLSCIDDKLMLAINDKLVAKVIDRNPLPERGTIAFLVGATGKNGFSAAFDDVIVRAP